MYPLRVDYAELWDFNDPAGSEVRFREFLRTARGTDWLIGMTQLARALGLQKLFEEASEILEKAAIEIEPGSPPQVIWLLEMGRCLNSSGSPEGAKPLFENAFALGKSLGLELWTIDAAHMVAIVTKGDESRAWNERGLELARGAKEKRAQQWEATLLNNLGWADFGESKLEEALAKFVKARELREEYGQKDREQIGRWCIGRVLRELGRIDEAREIMVQLSKEVPDDQYVQEELAALG